MTVVSELTESHINQSGCFLRCAQALPSSERHSLGSKYQGRYEKLKSINEPLAYEGSVHLGAALDQQPIDAPPKKLAKNRFEIQARTPPYRR
jgi:hypothetical protein